MKTKKRHERKEREKATKIIHHTSPKPHTHCIPERPGGKATMMMKDTFRIQPKNEKVSWKDMQRLQAQFKKARVPFFQGIRNGKLCCVAFDPLKNYRSTPWRAFMPPAQNPLLLTPTEAIVQVALSLSKMWSHLSPLARKRFEIVIQPPDKPSEDDPLGLMWTMYWKYTPPTPEVKPRGVPAEVEAYMKHKPEEERMAHP